MYNGVETGSDINDIFKLNVEQELENVHDKVHKKLIGIQESCAST